MNQINKIQTNLSITNVTLFYQGAEITMQGELDLKAGENEIAIKGFPLYFDTNSVQITTPKGIALLSTEYQTKNIESTLSSEAIEKLKTELESIETSIIQINNKIKTNESTIEILTIPTRMDSFESITLESLVQYADTYRVKNQTLLDEITNLEKDLLISETKKNELKKELGIIGENAKKELILNAKIYAASEQEKSLVKIVFFTEQASWTPYYDIEVKNIADPLELMLKAEIAQQTGIDWDGVKLKLMTVKQSAGQVAPLFSAWYLNFVDNIIQKPVPRKSMGQMKQNSYTYASAEMAVPELFEEELYDLPPSPIQESNEISYTFQLETLCSLKGDGQEKQIELNKKQVNANFTYYCVPKMGDDAYLLAEISNWADLGLIAGNANIRLYDTYMGSTYINPQTIEEKLTLTLGKDSRINVTRVKVQDSSTRSILGSDIKKTFTYKITAKNNQNGKIKMTIKDQQPLSNTKAIEVEMLKDTTKPSFFNEELGVLVWDVELEAGEIRSFVNSFCIRYPKDKQIGI